MGPICRSNSSSLFFCSSISTSSLSPNDGGLSPTAVARTPLPPTVPCAPLLSRLPPAATLAPSPLLLPRSACAALISAGLDEARLLATTDAWPAAGDEWRQRERRVAALYLLRTLASRPPPPRWPVEKRIARASRPRRAPASSPLARPLARFPRASPCAAAASRRHSLTSSSAMAPPLAVVVVVRQSSTCSTAPRAAASPSTHVPRAPCRPPAMHARARHLRLPPRPPQARRAEEEEKSQSGEGEGGEPRRAAGRVVARSATARRHSPSLASAATPAASLSHCRRRLSPLRSPPRRAPLRRHFARRAPLRPRALASLLAVGGERRIERESTCGPHGPTSF